MNPDQLLPILLQGRTLSDAEAESVFDRLLEGGYDEPQTAAMLALIEQRGVTEDELLGAARAMRRKVEPVPTPSDAVPVIDTCGTGGTPKTFNVSTGAALVAAAAAPGRLRVAKHGNRSRTGRGSAEVLQLLGVNIDAPVPVQARCLHEAGVCFCFAIRHHPATRHAAGVRRSLPFRTLFNLLGPLTNPAGATRQVMGIYDPDRVEMVARVLHRLGAERAMVFHSEDGLDELSLSAPTRIWHVEPEGARHERFTPPDAGLAVCKIEELRVETLEDAAQTIKTILAGEPGPRSDFVVLSAAAALRVAGLAEDWPASIAMAREAIDSGAATKTLETLARISHEPA